MKRWLLFLTWTLAGASLALGVSQIGVFTVLPGLVLIIVLARRGIGREALGLLEGVGIIAALVGMINLDYHPCSSGPETVAPGQGSYECGGFDGTPWLILGLLLMAAAVLVFWQRGQRTKGRTAPFVR